MYLPSSGFVCPKCLDRALFRRQVVSAGGHLVWFDYEKPLLQDYCFKCGYCEYPK